MISQAPVTRRLSLSLFAMKMEHGMASLLLVLLGLISSICYSSSSSIVSAHVIKHHHGRHGSHATTPPNHQQHNYSSWLHHDKSKFPRVWPLPHHFTSGVVDSEGRKRYSSLSLAAADQFRFEYRIIESSKGDANAGKVDVEEPSSPLLDEAFQRYRALIFSRPSFDSLPSRSRLISSLLVHVHSSHESLQYGADESYSLAVPDPVDASRAYIQANTVFGALRGLETFSQLCVFDFESRSVQVGNAPWLISDQPRFAYRGLLIDTARHYQPPRVMKQVIDAMAYAKLNVLHWHIVDSQSFPLEIPSYPKLWQGSYSPWERYTIHDARDIVDYARKRGINVMAELDVPGHASSWGVGYPELWPSVNCTQPLDVSRNSTFGLIDGIISDFAKVFPFEFVHMGGDEVNTSCWTRTPRINKWLKRNNFTGFDAYKHFVLQADAISSSHGYTPVNWEETFDNFGAQLNKKTVIHNWLGAGVAPLVVKAGFRCIVSNQEAWYLDHVEQTWQKFYMNEPLVNITDAKEQALVLGGEVCMWAEVVDPSDIQQTIWPRAAAAAERLWSSLDGIAEDPEDALPRLRHFRCLLNERGIAAAPVSSRRGRDPPNGPKSCYSQ